MKRNISLSALLLLGALPLGAIAADATTATGSGSGTSSAQGEQAPMFRQLDSNRDGYVNKEEAQRSADLSSRFNDLDTDRDGRISSAEYRKSEQQKQQ